MKATRRRWLVTGGALVGSLLSADAFADDFVLVRNVKNTKASMTKPEVRKIFTGQTKTWPTGAVVQVVLGEEASPELKWLATVVFALTPRELLTKIQQEIFRGEMKRPVMVKSPADAVAVVVAKEGAVAVIDGSSAKNLPANVAILKLE